MKLPVKTFYFNQHSHAARLNVGTMKTYLEVKFSVSIKLESRVKQALLNGDDVELIADGIKDKRVSVVIPSSTAQLRIASIEKRTKDYYRDLPINESKIVEKSVFTIYVNQPNFLEVTESEKE